MQNGDFTVTGKERVLKAMRREKVDRVPWVPFVGCHAGALLGKTATEYLKSSELIVQGINEAVKLYRPDGLPVVFDLQVEAEVLGCDLSWADDNPPAVCSHPLANGTKLSDLQVPGADVGRIKTSLDAAKKARAAQPDIALYGLITGPFTLALHLLGTDIFMKMFDDAEFVHELLGFCTEVGKAMSGYYIEAGCDVIGVVDPMTSQIGAEQFKQFISPYATAVFEHIREKGALGSFFVCGHAQQNIEVMADCKCDNISIDENIPLDFVRDKCEEKGISFGGNMQLTSVLLLGTVTDSQKNAIACIEIGGEVGFILAPGCDLPYATPVENLAGIIAVVEDVEKREAVKLMANGTDASEKLDLAEYGKADKVIVDIITLDSEACAPCQYMVDAVRRIAPEFEGIVEWREHKIKYRESLVFMTSLMVRNVPTICIDGEIKFVSRIPPKDELISAIQQRINEKMRMRIRSKKATIYILHNGCDEAQELKERCLQAVAELGEEVDVQLVDDADIVRTYGLTVSQLPAVVLAKHQLKAVRKVPEKDIIKEWLKDL